MLATFSYLASLPSLEEDIHFIATLFGLNSSILAAWILQQLQTIKQIQIWIVFLGGGHTAQPYIKNMFAISVLQFLVTYTLIHYFFFLIWDSVYPLCFKVFNTYSSTDHSVIPICINIIEILFHIGCHGLHVYTIDSFSTVVNLYFTLFTFTEFTMAIYI